jgi:hypothetical protein
LHHQPRRQRDFDLGSASTRPGEPFTRRQDRDDADSGSAANFIRSINQKDAPQREPRNPFHLFRFEMRAASPARPGT